MDDLDCRLAALGRVEIDRDLGGIESAVWAQIEAEEPALCAGAALFASFIGFVQPAHMSAFAVHMPVAPSTILGD